MKKESLDILHIYGGTAGTAGLYIDSIFKSLAKKFSQECIVNAYFHFGYGKKVFYTITELSGKNRLANFGLLRYLVRYFELIFALLFSTAYVIKNKPKVINYSLTTHFYIEYLFLYFIKKYTKSVLIITCHDVMPFDLPFINQAKFLNKRKKFFTIADRLLVHNENSIQDLQSIFDINDEYIVKHKFPIMDLRKITSTDSKSESALLSKHFVNNNRKTFSFIGHFRKEKGIQILIDAWKLIDFNKCSSIFLNVLGNSPPNVNFDFTNLINFSISKRFLTDSEYSHVVQTSDFIVLPYVGGTNSGIPSSVMSLGSIPIASDIPMFRNNELLCDELFFKSGCPVSLAEKIKLFSEFDCQQTQDLRTKLAKLLAEYSNSFDIEVIELYQKLISIQRVTV